VSDLDILAALRHAAGQDPTWGQLPELADERVGLHVAVMVEPFLTHLLEGRKTIESRFSQRATQPYGRVSVGDLVLLKSGPVVGSFLVATVQNLTLDAQVLAHLEQTHSEAICADENFWKDRATKRYATLLGVRQVRTLPPVPIPKRDMRGWVVLREAHSGSRPQQQLELI
jgi:hypothetical protein